MPDGSIIGSNSKFVGKVLRRMTIPGRTPMTSILVMACRPAGLGGWR